MKIGRAFRRQLMDMVLMARPIYDRAYLRKLDGKELIRLRLKEDILKVDHDIEEACLDACSIKSLSAELSRAIHDHELENIDDILTERESDSSDSYCPSDSTCSSEYTSLEQSPIAVVTSKPGNQRWCQTMPSRSKFCRLIFVLEF